VPVGYSNEIVPLAEIEVTGVPSAPARQVMLFVQS
jgi:hypothetical protein